MAGLILLLGAALAADFSGQWALDQDASTDIGPLLRAQGISWAEAKLADTVAITQHVEQSDDAVALRIETTFMSRENVIRPDDVWRDVETQRNGVCPARAYWDGETLVTEQRIPSGLFSTRRDLDGDVTTLTIRLETDEKKYEAVRILNRIP